MCKDDAVRLNLSPDSRETVLENLQKFAEYRVYLMGYNRIGIGSKSHMVQIRTDEDGKQ